MPELFSSTEPKMYKERIIDLETSEEVLRDYTDAEIAEVKKAQAMAQVEAETTTLAAAAKAALLEKLGITEDEACLLLG